MFAAWISPDIEIHVFGQCYQAALQHTYAGLKSKRKTQNFLPQLIFLPATDFPLKLTLACKSWPDQVSLTAKANVDDFGCDRDSFLEEVEAQAHYVRCR